MSRADLTHEGARQGLSTLTEREDVKRDASARTAVSTLSERADVERSGERLGVASAGPVISASGTWPSFDTITHDEGSTVINFGCDISVSGKVRFRVRRIENGYPYGPYIYSEWSLSSKTDGHERQVTGLWHNTTYRCWIEIDADEGLDLGWTEFTEGEVGPDYTTLGRGEEDPADPDNPP